MVTFLTAYWKYLAMLNYEIDPKVLAPYVPPGTELDSFDGKTFVSLVGFRFLDTRVLGMPIPFHRNFEEVNLRFYVRLVTGGEVRRGVVFIREIVPRMATAFVARNLYGENYIALPTRHQIELQLNDSNHPSLVSYQWRFKGAWNSLSVKPIGPPQQLVDGSEEEFITEHYWGYTKQADGRSSEYRVEHPRWNIWPVESSDFNGDVSGLYGPQFTEYLRREPSSAFLADGSLVSVRFGNHITKKDT